MAALVAGFGGVDAGTLGFKRCHRAPGPVAKHVIGLCAVRQRAFEADAHSVREIPLGIPQQGVNLDAGERFGRSAHKPSQGLNISIPMSSKSRTLRVATAIPRERAIAAIWQSACVIGLPRWRRTAAIPA